MRERYLFVELPAVKFNLTLQAFLCFDMSMLSCLAGKWLFNDVISMEGV